LIPWERRLNVHKKLFRAAFVAVVLSLGLCSGVALVSMTATAHADNNP